MSLAEYNWTKEGVHDGQHIVLPPHCWLDDADGL
jgi:hypothetical protein